MGQLDDDTTQDGLGGSLAPLGLSRSARSNINQGVWSPVIRKALAITLGGLALAAIGTFSMAHHAQYTSTAPLLTAAVPGVEPLEWLAQSATSATPPAHRSPESALSTHDTGATTPPNGSDAERSSCPPPNPPPPTNQGGGILPDGRVVLNIATVAELQTLPGIGRKRAESIVALREHLRGLKKLSDLLRVKGIGVKSLRKLEPKVTLNPPPAPATSTTNGSENTVPSGSSP